MTNRVAMVTGGGTGIGRAAALALARDGFSVVIAGRRQNVLDETVSRAVAGGSSMRAHAADLADPDQVAALFASIRAAEGRLDVLFNNAGRGSPATPLEDVPPETWLSVVGVNLNATFFCTQHAFKLMKDQQPRGGRIINNGSISAHAPRPNSAPYTATKHAITGLTRATSLDGRQYDIACSQIDIGNAATEMASRMADGVPQADGQIRPEPLMDVEHVADAVVFIARLPLETNVQFMTIMATKMPFVGRG